LGFPGYKNESVDMFDITLNYPANTDQVQQEAKLAGIEPAKIKIMTKEWDDSMQEEFNRYEETVRLETEDYPDASKEQKEASTKYSESFKDIVKNATKSEFTIAGDKTKAAKFNTDDKEGVNSPLTKTKRNN